LIELKMESAPLCLLFDSFDRTQLLL